MGFFDWLKNRFKDSAPATNSPPAPSYSLATSPDLIPPYVEGFEQAVRFTRSLGYDTTLLSLSDPSVDLLDRDGSFVDPAFEAAGIVDRTQAAVQCLKWCHFLQPYFQRQLGKRVMLTTGQLWKGETCVFGPTFEDVRRWNAAGLQLADFEVNGGFRLHAWLTVESGEIIDPTILSSLAMVNQSYKKYAGATVCGRDPYVLNTHRYVPVTVGNDIIEHIASQSIAPILATNLSELGAARVVIVGGR